MNPVLIARGHFYTLKPRISKLFIILKVFILVCVLMPVTTASAQSTNINGDNIGLLTQGFFLFIVLLVVLYSLNLIRKAGKVLRENGQELDFRFPIFRGMAENSTVITALIVLIVLTGIWFAINYKG